MDAHLEALRSVCTERGVSDSAMRIAVVHPGVAFGTGDVAAGLTYGLEQLGVHVQSWTTEFAYDAAARRGTRWERIDVVIAVTAIRPPGLVDALLAAGHTVTALFTESPYEAAAEFIVAANVAGCWTHERTAVKTFRTVSDNIAYLPHAWHPLVHTATPQPGDDQVPAHDVVFVGAGVRERITFFNAIDWTGIDLGLYGIWDGLGLKESLEGCIKGEGPITNVQAAALYRRARIGLNLYRRLPVLGPDRQTLASLGQDEPANWLQAESLGPRAYELAACGCLQLSEYRAEVHDVFGDDLEMTFTTPAEASVLIRDWLAAPRCDRGWTAHEQRACVAASSWIDRAGQVLQDLRAWGLTEAIV
jgi:spore maturation protein CgeB